MVVKEQSTLLSDITKGLNRFSLSLFSILIVFVLTWLVLLGFSNYNGEELFWVFFYAPFVNAKRMTQVLLVFAPFLIGAIAVWIGFQLGLINLGVGGQMAGAGLTVYFVAYLLRNDPALVNVKPMVWLPLLLGVGIMAAVLISCFCGMLKVYFGVNEILSTIFTNYIIYYLFRYLVTLEEIVNPVTKLSTQEDLGGINFNAIFGLFSVAFILALMILATCWFVFSRTRLGLQISLIGKNRIAAQYSGLNVNRQTMLVFFISGVLAGLAGIFYYYRDPVSTFLDKDEALPSNGYDTITIVALSQSSLLTLPVTSFFIALLRVQQEVIKISNIDPVIVEIMIGLIILAVVFFTKIFNDRNFFPSLQSGIRECLHKLLGYKATTNRVGGITIGKKQPIKAAATVGLATKKYSGNKSRSRS